MGRATILQRLKPPPSAPTGLTFQGVAYTAPVVFDAKGDNKAAVIFVSDVDGDRFRAIADHLFSAAYVSFWNDFSGVRRRS